MVWWAVPLVSMRAFRSASPPLWIIHTEASAQRLKELKKCTVSFCLFFLGYTVFFFFQQKNNKKTWEQLLPIPRLRLSQNLYTEDMQCRTHAVGITTAKTFPSDGYSSRYINQTMETDLCFIALYIGNLRDFQTSRIKR